MQMFTSFITFLSVYIINNVQMYNLIGIQFLESDNVKL